MDFRNILRKFKPKLMLLVLTALLAIPVALQNPITAYATQPGNQQGSDDNSDHTNTDQDFIVDGGGSGVATWDQPGPNKTGWLVYLASTKNLYYTGTAEIISDVVYVSASSTQYNDAWKHEYLKTRLVKGSEGVGSFEILGGTYSTVSPDRFKIRAPWVKR